MRAYRYLIVGGGMTGDAACKGIREHDARRGDRPRRRGAASAVRAAASHEGALEGRRRGEDLARDSRPRRRPDARTACRLARPRRAPRDGRRRATYYEYERLLLATGGSPRRLPFGGDGIVYFRYARRLPAFAHAGEGRCAGRRDRRRLHRLRDRSGARDERVRRHHGLPGRRDRRPGLPRRALPPT